MAETAKVDNIEALKNFKRALWKFSEVASVALTEAESDLQRTLIWLETEQRSYWNNELRKRHEAVERAKQAVRDKQLYKDASGARSSAVDEMKLLQVAQRRFGEAEQKLVNVKKYVPRLQKEAQAYRGGVQRFASTVQGDLPVAAAKLEQMSAALEAYVSLGSGAPTEVGSAADLSVGRTDSDIGAGMNRIESAPLPSPAPLAGPFPELKSPKVAMTYVEAISGNPMTKDGEFPQDGLPIYDVFDSVQLAMKQAKVIMESEARLQCNILDEEGNLLHLIRPDATAGT